MDDDGWFPIITVDPDKDPLGPSAYARIRPEETEAPKFNERRLRSTGTNAVGRDKKLLREGR